MCNLYLPSDNSNLMAMSRPMDHHDTTEGQRGGDGKYARKTPVARLRSALSGAAGLALEQTGRVRAGGTICSPLATMHCV
jgi:hypothetical protein